MWTGEGQEVDKTVEIAYSETVRSLRLLTLCKMTKHKWAHKAHRLSIGQASTGSPHPRNQYFNLAALIMRD